MFRVELLNWVGFESRQYMERLIDLAKKYGDKHEGMMEMADYWLLEKDLVPKLFQVIAPRFEYQMGPYTDVHKLTTQYPGRGVKNIVLELKKNPLPPIINPSTQRDYSGSLSNVLLKALRQEYKLKNEATTAAPETD